MVAMGFVMKSMPQVNVLSVGFAVYIVGGLSVLALALFAINARFGLAAVAGSSDDFDQAREQYALAASLATDAGFAPLAQVASEMEATAGQINPPALHEESDFPRLPFEPEPLESTIGRPGSRSWSRSRTSRPSTRLYKVPRPPELVKTTPRSRSSSSSSPRSSTTKI